MDKLFVVLILIMATGCTHTQRFALKLKAELDACAMDRMSRTKISGEQGYLQAHNECHKIVNIQKMRALHLANYIQRPYIDPIKDNEICWQYVNGMIIDKQHPELRLSENEIRLPDKRQRHNKMVERNAKVNGLPDNLFELTDEQILTVREIMISNNIVDRIHEDPLCDMNRYHNLEHIIGREIHRRYPYGVEDNIAGGVH